MIYLNKSTTNPVVVTLNEKTTIINPYYLWEIIDSDTNLKYYFTGDDFSTAPYNYNLFSFSVVDGATQGLTQGIVPAPVGKYIYNVYETPIQYDLNIQNTVGKVEIGILNILGDVPIIKTFTASDSIKTFKK